MPRMLNRVLIGVSAMALASCSSVEGVKDAASFDRSNEALNAQLGTMSGAPSPDNMDVISKAAYWGTRYDRNPSDADTAVNYSKALRDMENNEEALKVMTRFAETVRANADVNLELGKVLIANDRAFESVRPLERAIDADPRNWSAYSADGVALDTIGEHDLVGLAWTENGFRHMTNSQRDIETPEDAQGLKIRTMENEMHMAAFNEMGVHPTPMAFPELFTALQQGTVDGQENPISVILTGNLWEVQDRLSLTGHVYSPAIMLASPILWDGLSDEQKGWFMEAAQAGAEATRAMVSRLETEGVEELKAKGMTVVEDIDKSQFQAAVEPSYSVYTDEYGSEMLDRIRSSDCGS